MAVQKIQHLPPSRTAVSQGPPALKDNQRKVNATHKQGVEKNVSQTKSEKMRPISCAPSSTRSAQNTNTNIPGNAAGSHGLNIDERLRLARERREEHEKLLLSKEQGWQARAERARHYHEKQLEERKRRLVEQRLREEKRRRTVEEKRMQRLKEEKERYESAVRRTVEKSQRVAKQKSTQSSRGRKLVKNNGPRRLPLSLWEENLVNRLLTPTCSYLARSKSAAYQSQEEVSCHTAKAAIPHKSRPHPGPVDHRITRSTGTSHRNNINTLAQTKVAHPQKTEKKYEGRPPQVADAKLRVVKPSTNSPNRAAEPSPKRSENTSATTHVTLKQNDLSAVPEENIGLPQALASVCPRNSQVVTTPLAPPCQEPTEESTSVSPSASSPGPQTATTVTTETGELPPAGFLSRPSAGTTDPEEASRLLAVKRREARERREREEEERLQREERERRGKEELERRRAEERARLEALRLTEERKRREDEELKEAQAEEARRALEEAALLQKEREEEMAREQEKAEQQRLEREKAFQREEDERQARKKRLEEIMKRTRKSNPAVETPAQTQTLSKETQPKETTENVNNVSMVGVRTLPQLGLPVGVVEDMVPVVAFKERRSLRSLSGLEDIQNHQRAEVI